VHADAWLHGVKVGSQITLKVTNQFEYTGGSLSSKTDLTMRFVQALSQFFVA
jgi:hypothetical protein